jgi:hypothetical protein
MRHLSAMLLLLRCCYYCNAVLRLPPRRGHIRKGKCSCSLYYLTPLIPTHSLYHPGKSLQSTFLNTRRTSGSASVHPSPRRLFTLTSRVRLLKQQRKQVTTAQLPTPIIPRLTPRARTQRSSDQLVYCQRARTGFACAYLLTTCGKESMP